MKTDVNHLKTFTVISHKNGHEFTSTVIAKNEIHACDLVGGKIMDVSLAGDIEAQVLTFYSWNMRYHTPSHSHPTERAIMLGVCNEPR